MKIFVTRQIPGDELEKLKTENEVTISEFDRPLTPAELVEKIKGVYAILSLLNDKIDGDVMDAAGPQLKIISNYAVGFDNINIKDASDRGIIVTNTPCEEVNVAVAEHTIALLTNLSRRITESDRAVHDGAYKGWEPGIFLGSQIKGKTIGIIGLGRIGEMVAEIAKSMGLNCLYNKSHPDPEIEQKLGIKFASLDDLLTNSDFISLHIPLTEETRHMINKNSLSKIKKGSFLINTARGAVVDEQALVEVLRFGQLAGAALDVFDNEPNINPELIGMENVILTPHIASATVEARAKMGELAVSSILKINKNEKPETIVNPEVWEKRRN